jgi:hypothetical protein
MKIQILEKNETVSVVAVEVGARHRQEAVTSNHDNDHHSLLYGTIS